MEVIRSTQNVSILTTIQELRSEWPVWARIISTTEMPKNMAEFHSCHI